METGAVVHNPYLVGLVGQGVGPSLTPLLHMAEGRAHGLDYVYRTIDLNAAGLAAEQIGDIMTWARALGFNALNITHPCKKFVIGHLDALDEVAAALGAVNTVVFEDQSAIGYNTDAPGFRTGFAEGLTGAATSNVVLLGAGGAGSAVGHALLELGTEHLTVVDLDVDRATVLASELADRHRGAHVEACAFDKLSILLPHNDGVVHCTPTGMADHPGMPFDAALLHSGLWVADIVYRPLDTALLTAAREAGCRTLDGGLMAVHQATTAFELITGITPDAERMSRHFRRLAGELARRRHFDRERGGTHERHQQLSARRSASGRTGTYAEEGRTGQLHGQRCRVLRLLRVRFCCRTGLSEDLLSRGQRRRSRLPMSFATLGVAYIARPIGAFVHRPLW